MRVQTTTSARHAPADRSPGRFEAVNGLRALAAGSVLAYHLGQATAASRLHVLEPFISELKAGVTIFFVISSFLLYLPYAQAIGIGRALPSWRRFARRRAARIVPGYWVALTVVALAPFPTHVFSSGWWRFYSLTQIYNHGALFQGLGVAWTLSVEVTFYALLPVFAWLVARLVQRSRPAHAARIQLSLVAAMGFGALALRLVVAHSPTAPTLHHGMLLVTSLPGMLDWFAVGMAFAVVVAAWELDPQRFPRIMAMVARPGGCWLVATTLFTAAVLSAPSDFFLPDYGLVAHVAIGLAAGMLVLPAINPVPVARTAWPIRLLTNPVMAWLGTISYGIYLWHLQLLKLIVGPFDRIAAHPPSLAAALGLSIVTVIGAVGLGAASWYLVERPAQRLMVRAQKGRACGDLRISGIRVPAFQAWLRETPTSPSRSGRRRGFPIRPMIRRSS